MGNVSCLGQGCVMLAFQRIEGSDSLRLRRIKDRHTKDNNCVGMSLPNKPCASNEHLLRMEKGAPVTNEPAADNAGSCGTEAGGGY